jgi:hypothetical protein
VCGESDTPTRRRCGREPPPSRSVGLARDRRGGAPLDLQSCGRGSTGGRVRLGVRTERLRLPLHRGLRTAALRADAGGPLHRGVRSGDVLGSGGAALAALALRRRAPRRAALRVGLRRDGMRVPLPSRLWTGPLRRHARGDLPRRARRGGVLGSPLTRRAAPARGPADRLPLQRRRAGAATLTTWMPS